MKVFATGATGFVGAHTALALLAGGHELRLLARNAAAARRWFAARGHRVELVTADIRDRAALREAMAGCDAAFHAAASVSLDPTRAQETYDNNVGAAQAVLGAALDAGLRNVVYVSSLSALFHAGWLRVDETAPLAQVREPYSRSKRDADAHARSLQAQGAPVQIIYPAAVIGPDDPKLSEANGALASFVGRVIPLTSSGFQCVDVRDLALAHRWLLEHPPDGDPQAARYIVGGHYYPWALLRERLERVLGRRLFALRLRPGVMRAMGAAVDLCKKVVPFESQVSAEAMSFVTQWPPADSGRLLARTGISFRPGDETFADTIRWLVEAGRLPVKRAGRLAPPAIASAPKGVS